MFGVITSHVSRFENFLSLMCRIGSITANSVSACKKHNYEIALPCTLRYTNCRSSMNFACVFCGSSSGGNDAYQKAARGLGEAIVRAGLRLVYGGGRVGLMGILCDAVLSAGGQVTGVMPRALFEREIAHRGVSDLRIVQNMHERKELMSNLADAFIALPGGAGTLEEMFEQWTWSQLGIHAKPCGFLNVNDYFTPLMAMIERMVTEGFMERPFAAMLAVETEPDELLARFRAYQPPVRKWAIQRSSAVQP
jgi:uncharacterized protein (TIGR00730 family)